MVVPEEGEEEGKASDFHGPDQSWTFGWKTLIRPENQDLARMDRGWGKGPARDDLEEKRSTHKQGKGAREEATSWRLSVSFLVTHAVSPLLTSQRRPILQMRTGSKGSKGWFRH